MGLPTAAGDRRALVIYLNDHLAGSVVGREVAARCRSSNRGSSLEAFLTTFLAQVAEERTAIERILSAVGGSPSRAKIGAAWLAEKLGRAKLNGRLLAYSPLSRVEELEALILGVRAKRALWSTLLQISERSSAFDAELLSGLGSRAEDQERALEGFHRQAVIEALTPARPPG